MLPQSGDGLSNLPAQNASHITRGIIDTMGTEVVQTEEGATDKSPMLS